MDQDNNEEVSQTQESQSETVLSEVNEQKLYAILGYIIPFLFFLPLVMESSKNNQFARFHANQQLILLIILVGIEFFLTNILHQMIGFGAYTFMPLIHLALLVLVIMGVINAAQGEMKELPVVGRFRLLK